MSRAGKGVGLGGTAVRKARTEATRVAAHIQFFDALDAVMDEVEVFSTPIHVFLVVDKIAISVYRCIIALPYGRKPVNQRSYSPFAA